MKETTVKSKYNSPTVETLSVRVEAGMQTSGNGAKSNTTQYTPDSWDTPGDNTNARYN